MASTEKANSAGAIVLELMIMALGMELDAADRTPGRRVPLRKLELRDTDQDACERERVA